MPYNNIKFSLSTAAKFSYSKQYTQPLPTADNVMFFSASGVDNIDALTESSWQQNEFTAVNITYSFDAPRSSYLMMNAVQQQYVRDALTLWSNVANISWSEISGTADISFAQGDLSAYGALGATFLTSNNANLLTGADIVMDAGQVGGFIPGQQAFMILLHEIGHALGLKHPFESSPTLDSGLDDNEFTVMSYTGDADIKTPQILDIAAVQYLYGSNDSYNNGDTNIILEPDSFGNSNKFTIWDGGGNDTIDGRAQTESITIDLGETTSNKSTIADDFYFYIAAGSNIERAIGGAGDDTIYGNGLDNWLYGHSGNDIISGKAGNDIIVDGKDFADSNDGSGVIYGDSGNDIIYGNAGDDSLYGGSAINDASETGNDTIYGGLGNDYLYGNGGDDVLVSSAGNDYLYGGAGSDYFVFTWNNGFDTVYPFEVGSDILRVPYNINNSGITTAADVISASISDSYHTYINFGEGNGVLLLFTYGNFSASDVEII